MNIKRTNHPSGTKYQVGNEPYGTVVLNQDEFNNAEYIFYGRSVAYGLPQHEFDFLGQGFEQEQPTQSKTVTEDFALELTRILTSIKQ